jgi:hypothetical protein
MLRADGRLRRMADARPSPAIRIARSGALAAVPASWALARRKRRRVRGRDLLRAAGPDESRPDGGGGVEHPSGALHGPDPGARLVCARPPDDPRSRQPTRDGGGGRRGIHRQRHCTGLRDDLVRGVLRSRRMRCLRSRSSTYECHRPASVESSGATRGVGGGPAAGAERRVFASHSGREPGHGGGCPARLPQRYLTPVRPARVRTLSTPCKPLSSRSRSSPSSRSG